MWPHSPVWFLLLCRNHTGLWKALHNQSGNSKRKAMEISRKMASLMRTGKERFTDRSGDIVVYVGMGRMKTMGQLAESWSRIWKCSNYCSQNLVELEDFSGLSRSSKSKVIGQWHFNLEIMEGKVLNREKSRDHWLFCLIHSQVQHFKFTKIFYYQRVTWIH